MVLKLLYFGEDRCYRLPVLSTTGFAVDHRPAMAEFREGLASGRLPNAVLLTDSDEQALYTATTLVRSHPGVRLILFRETNRTCDESPFDLIIPILTPPSHWLREIALLLGAHSVSGSLPQPPQRDTHVPADPPSTRTSAELPAKKPPTSGAFDPQSSSSAGL